MSEPTYSDPAASPGGGVRVSQEATSSGAPVIAKVARRWWLVATCVVIALLAAFAYLVAADKVYAATCVIAAEQLNGGPDSASGGRVPSAEFLYGQRDLINSPLVVSAAATTAIKSDAQIRNGTEVSVSKSDGVINVTFQATRPDDAARGANAVAEAYLRVRQQEQGATSAGLADLAKQRDRLAVDRAAKESAVKQLRETVATSGSDADRAAAARVEQLQQAITAAEVESTNASAALATGKQLSSDPQQLRAVVEANRGKGIFDRLDAQRNAIELERRPVEQQLERQKQSMLPQHPVVLATQRKLDGLNAKLAELDKQYAGVYLAHLEQQRATAQNRVDGLKRLVDEQSSQAKAFAARAAKVAEAEAELTKADAAIAEVDQRIRDATVSSGASAAPTVRIVVPAQPPTRASKPDAMQTLMTFGLAGIVSGLLLAAILPRGTRR
jgi:uncharacterized protein involved in exopolysaccharide biosynthesis